MSVVSPDERLRMFFMRINRLKEDIEQLGGEVAVKTSIIFNLEDIEYLGPVEQTRFEDLDKVAIDIAGDPSMGEFMRKAAETWLAADKVNKEILRPVWERIFFKDRIGRFMEG